jgi:hypothetical protein
MAALALGMLLAQSAPRSGGLGYFNDRIEDKPWSIHVLKIDRTRSDYEFQTTLAKGSAFGLTTLTEQLKTLSPELGEPLAAINGDFWKDGRVEGDPMGLQILQGEVISGPVQSRVCFWIDTNGAPQMGNVLSLFKVTWPDGRNTPLGLNEDRAAEAAVLYTSRIGESTHTRGGRDIVLERAGTNVWLPLRPGGSYVGKVREIRENGDARVTSDTLVISLSPQLESLVAGVAPGTQLKISAHTSPDLTGVKTAVGGSPALIRGGVPVKFGGSQPRHPRTAVGWNETHVFFVEVDGRQRGLSVGMSLPELADYLLKLGCKEAMNLDGGGSSTLWVHGQIMNSPCNGHERAMANALVLTQRRRQEVAPADPNPPD